MRNYRNNNYKPYIIGETAYHHEGDMGYMLKMVDDIVHIGLSAVKFHLLLKPESYLQKDHPMLSEYKKWIFSPKRWSNIFDHCKNKKLDVIALCDDVESLKFINQRYSKIFAVELHSTGLNDFYLLNEALKFKGYIILGVGGSTLDEIENSISFLKKNGKDNIILMYGIQNYPTNYADINLEKMLKIKKLFNLPVGYADHTVYDDPNNEIVSCMAAMMGVNILEKHYTPTPGQKRIDYHSAVDKEQMTKIKQLMKLALTIRGNGEMEMSEAELKYANNGPMKKAIVAKKNIKKGDRLSINNLWFKRTREETTLKQHQFWNIIDLKAAKDIKKDEIIDYSKVEYKFKEYKITDFTSLRRKK